ncbi:hypothetical protein PR048_002436, partial [Dryococelus australis]
MINIKLYLNSQSYPYMNFNTNSGNCEYLMCYNMYKGYQETHYGKESAPILEPESFKTREPVFVFDISKQMSPVPIMLLINILKQCFIIIIIIIIIIIVIITITIIIILTTIAITIITDERCESDLITTMGFISRSHCFKRERCGVNGHARPTRRHLSSVLLNQSPFLPPGFAFTSPLDSQRARKCAAPTPQNRSDGIQFRKVDIFITSDNTFQSIGIPIYFEFSVGEQGIFNVPCDIVYFIRVNGTCSFFTNVRYRIVRFKIDNAYAPFPLQVEWWKMYRMQHGATARK